jgi:hypothetical protein
MPQKRIKPVGNRSDKRGHWPKGKRRNDPGRKWPAVRKRLDRLLRTPDTGPIDESRPRRSQIGLGRYLDVSDRTIRRWLRGEQLPSEESVERIVAFCDAVS